MKLFKNDILNNFERIQKTPIPRFELGTLIHYKHSKHWLQYFLNVSELIFFWILRNVQPERNKNIFKKFFGQQKLNKYKAEIWMFAKLSWIIF